MVKDKLLFILLFVLVSAKIMAQRKPPNLPYYDNKTFHYGWYIGGNSLYTNIKSNHNLPYNDSIMSFKAGSGLGFQIGVLADARLLSFLHMRLLPVITFSERNFTFYVAKDNVLHETTNNLDVIYAELPLEMKIMSVRWHNFRPYLIGGAKYAYDLGSLRRKKLAEGEYLFKINDSEIFYTIGVGFDFYLPYFKLGVELKSSFGLTDVLDHDYQTVYSDCIDKMKTQVFYINVTFQ